MGCRASGVAGRGRPFRPVAAGALESREVEDLLQAGNVDFQALENYSRMAVHEFIPQLARQRLVPGQLQIFDFSERRQSNVSTMLLPANR